MITPELRGQLKRGGWVLIESTLRNVEYLVFIRGVYSDGINGNYVFRTKREGAEPFSLKCHCEQSTLIPGTFAFDAYKFVSLVTDPQELLKP